MATIKYVSIFEYMKKYNVPMPLWLAHPELEQDSNQWNSLGQRMLVRNLRRFLEGRSKHDQSLYRKLFPLPVDWDDWSPKSEMPPEDAYVSKRKLRIRKWNPQCPTWSNFTEEDAWCVCVGDANDFDPACFLPFLMRLDKDYTTNMEVYSIEHLLMLSYALYRGNTTLCDKLQLSGPGEAVWKETLAQCKNCHFPGWKEVLPHVLGLGVYRKVTQNEHLRKALVDTGERPIVYVDPDDHVLGGEFKNGKFCGQNLYGIALMQVRSEVNRIYDNLVFCLGTNDSSEEKQTIDLDFPF